MCIFCQIPQNCKGGEVKTYGLGWRFYDMNYKKSKCGVKKAKYKAIGL